MNALMARSWAGVEHSRKSVELSSALRDLAASPLVEHKGATVFRKLLSPGLGEPSGEDLTGFEATTNKIHVSDYVEGHCAGEALVAQGAGFAEAVVSRLAETGKPARVVLSRDLHSGAVTVRFFVKRSGQPWGSDNPDDYRHEEVVHWDV